jgi:hypothetical protein
MALNPRQIIETVCPGLFASPSLDMFIDMAVELTDRGFFGKLTNYAIAYRACHLFTLTGGESSGNPALGTGQISSISEGGLSMSFQTSQPDAGNHGLDTTKYGTMLLGLIKSRPTMGVNTAGLHTA